MFHHHRNNNNNNSNSSYSSTTMSRSRYEPVPQADDIIELSDPSYNYNTAIPNSPPPSFHSSQSTPAVSVSGDLELERERNYNNSTPRPVPSVIATGNSISSDGPLIMNLHRRVERLEETIGRLLLEKSESQDPADPSSSSTTPGAASSNCCVTFPELSALTNAERGQLLNSNSNCCVRFGGGRRRGGGGRMGGGRRHDETPEEWAERQHGLRTLKLGVLAVLGALFLMAWIIIMVWLTHRTTASVNCNSCDYGAVNAGAAWTAAGQGEDGTWAAGGS